MIVISSGSSEVYDKNGTAPHFIPYAVLRPFFPLMQVSLFAFNMSPNCDPVDFKIPSPTKIAPPPPSASLL